MILLNLTEEVADGYCFDVPCERYNFTYELPEREIIVYADRRRIEQVLENLISNAKKICMRKRKHSFSCKAGKIRQSIFLFSIRETPFQNRRSPKIWSKFYRGKWTGQSGNGLGLAIVSQILTIYQVPFGAINHTDGVEFYFQFPIDKQISQSKPCFPFRGRALLFYTDFTSNALLFQAGRIHCIH